MATERPTAERLAFIRTRAKDEYLASRGYVNQLLAEIDAIVAERDRLAAQLLQDAPLAAAARAYQEAHDNDKKSGANDRRSSLLRALLDLAREQKGGGK